MLKVTAITNAGSTRFFTAAPKSPTGSDAPPLQAFVKIVCLTTNTVIRDWTEEGTTIVGALVNIEVTAEENAMIDDANSKENRSVLLQTIFGVNDEFTDHADYPLTRIDLDPNATP